ncbi:hypothetical protein OEZ86_007533 [Tetradesmus obliquus]|nr:hypothetical protein OEZ86_007533 [Tetradesmus obliquus]
MASLRQEKVLLMQQQQQQQAAAVEMTDARLEEALLRALKKARSDKVSISNFTARAWGHMSSRSGLKMEVCLPSLLENVEDDTAAAKLGGFHWHPDQQEPAQADRYIPYLQQLIRLPGRTDYPLLWHQAGDRDKHLLDLAGYEDLLYYSNITGNTDAAIITRVNYLTHIVRGGLCVLFEFKKVVNEASVYQAVWAAVNPDLLDLADMLPAEEMQDVYARVLLQQVSRLPVFSTTEFKVAAASMYS